MTSPQIRRVILLDDATAAMVWLPAATSARIGGAIELTIVVVDVIPKSRWKLRRIAGYVARAEAVRARWHVGGESSQ